MSYTHKWTITKHKVLPADEEIGFDETVYPLEYTCKLCGILKTREWGNRFTYSGKNHMGAMINAAGDCAGRIA